MANSSRSITARHRMNRTQCSLLLVVVSDTLQGQGAVSQARLRRGGHFRPFDRHFDHELENQGGPNADGHGNASGNPTPMARDGKIVPTNETAIGGRVDYGLAHCRRHDTVCPTHPHGNPSSGGRVCRWWISTAVECHVWHVLQATRSIVRLSVGAVLSLVMPLRSLCSSEVT
jgi:hypothetical protein